MVYNICWNMESCIFKTSVTGTITSYIKYPMSRKIPLNIIIDETFNVELINKNIKKITQELNCIIRTFLKSTKCFYSKTTLIYLNIE